MPSLAPNAQTAVIDKASQWLIHEGYHSYIVGGFIRDLLLGRKSHDIDVAVDGDAISIAQALAQALKARFVLLDEVNGIARVVIMEQGQQWYLDFSSFSGSIESDLARRDFTIDAMAVELEQLSVIAGAVQQSQLKLIDPFSGEKDLRNRIVRAVREQVFEGDAVRLLRAIRLAAELDFAIEPETENLIRRYSQLITRIPGERIREELLRLLNLPRAAYHLRYLDQLGLLLVLVPELAQSKGVDQPTVHFWDVFDHSVETVAAIEFLIGEGEWKYVSEDLLSIVPWSDMIVQHLAQEVSKGSNHRVMLKFGGLFHDIAKPETKFMDESGRAHFYGHTKQGAAMTASVLERLRFSRREINLVESLVYHHLRPVQMANKELPTPRAIYRYFRDTGDAAIDILFLALADHLATCGPHLDMEEWKGRCQLVNYILGEHEKQQAKILPAKLIDGYDLMSVFDLPPGQLIGELLAKVREAQASGELSTKEEALALIQRELSLRAQRSNLSKTEGS